MMSVEGEAERSRPWLFVVACLCAVALVWGAYANSFHNAFHFDDSHVIETNLYIKSLGNLPLFFTDARTFSSLPANATYRPLVSASLALDHWLAGGLVLWYFHVSQFVMLLLLGVILFRVFLHVMDQTEAHWGNRSLALLCTVWFAVHTANTETINYISARWWVGCSCIAPCLVGGGPTSIFCRC
jgi:protein O-mannosyl-transferase